MGSAGIDPAGLRLQSPVPTYNFWNRPYSRSISCSHAGGLEYHAFQIVDISSNFSKKFNAEK